MSESSFAILLNGAPHDGLRVSDRAIHYGDGLYETIAVVEGRPRLWQAHMERLLQGCARLGIPSPDLQALAAECEQLANGQVRAVLKIIITRGSGGRGYRAPLAADPTRLVLRYPWPEQPDFQHGVSLRWCTTPLGCNPQLAGIKHLNRLEQVLARNEWQDEGIYEGLMCDLQGQVIEGTMSNLFALRDGALYTPDLGHCGVAGVMRQQLMALAEQRGMACVPRHLGKDELVEMDELMITNALIGVVPVHRLEDRAFPVTQGQAWREAMQQWLEGR